MKIETHAKMPPEGSRTENGTVIMVKSCVHLGMIASDRFNRESKFWAKHKSSDNTQESIGEVQPFIRSYCLTNCNDTFICVELERIEINDSGRQSIGRQTAVGQVHKAISCSSFWLLK